MDSQTKQIAAFDARHKNPDVTLYWDNPEYREAYHNALFIGEAAVKELEELERLEAQIKKPYYRDLGHGSFVASANALIKRIREKWSLPCKQ